MEEKHIYSASTWYKLSNLFESYKLKLVKFLSDLRKLKLPKKVVSFKPKLTPSLPTYTISQKPLQTKVEQEEKNKAKISERYSKPQIKIFIYALFTAIIFLMCLGILIGIRQF